MPKLNSVNSLEIKEKKLNKKNKIGKKFKALLIAALLAKGAIGDVNVNATEIIDTSSPDFSFAISDGKDYLWEEQAKPSGDLYFRDTNGDLIENITKLETLTMEGKTYTYITVGTEKYIYEGVPTQLQDWDEKNRVLLPSQFEQHGIQNDGTYLQVSGNENQKGVLVSNNYGDIAHIDNLYDDGGDRITLNTSAYIGEELIIVSDIGKLYKFPSQYLGQDTVYMTSFLDLTDEISSMGYNSEDIVSIRIESDTKTIIVDFSDKSVSFDLYSYLEQSNNLELTKEPVIDNIIETTPIDKGETVVSLTTFMDKLQTQLQEANYNIEAYRVDILQSRKEIKTQESNVENAEYRQSKLEEELKEGGVEDVDGKIKTLGREINNKKNELNSKKEGYSDWKKEKQEEYEELEENIEKNEKKLEEVKETRRIIARKVSSYAVKSYFLNKELEDYEEKKPKAINYSLDTKYYPTLINKIKYNSSEYEGKNIVVTYKFSSRGKFHVYMSLEIDGNMMDDIMARNSNHIVDLIDYYKQWAKLKIDIDVYKEKKIERDEGLEEVDGAIKYYETIISTLTTQKNEVFNSSYNNSKNRWLSLISEIKKTIDKLEDFLASYKEYKQLDIDISLYNSNITNLENKIEYMKIERESWKTERDRIQTAIDGYEYNKDPDNELKPDSKLWGSKYNFEAGESKTTKKVSGGKYGTENYITNPFTQYIQYDVNNTGHNYPAEVRIECDMGDTILTLGPVIANNYRFKEIVKKELKLQAKQMFAAMKFEKFSYKSGNYWIRTLDDNKFVSYYRRGTTGSIKKTPVYTNYNQIKYQALAMIDNGYILESSNEYKPDSKLWSGKRKFNLEDKKTSTKINGKSYGTEKYIQAPYTLYVKYDADGTGNNYPAKLWIEYDKGDSVGVIGPVIANNYTYKNKVKGALTTEAKAVFVAMPITKVDYRYGTYWIRGLGDGKFVGYYKISSEGVIHESNIYSSYAEAEGQLKKPLEAWYERVIEEKVDENDDVTKEKDFGEIEKDVVNLDENEVVKGMKFALWQDITAIVHAKLHIKKYDMAVEIALAQRIDTYDAYNDISIKDIVYTNGRYSKKVFDFLDKHGYIRADEKEDYMSVVLVGGEEGFMKLIADQNFNEIGEKFHPEKFFVDGMQDAVSDIFIGYAELLDYQTYVDLFKFAYAINRSLITMDATKLKEVFGETGEKIAYIWENKEDILAKLSEGDRQYFEGYLTFVVGSSLLPANKVSQARNIGKKVIDIERKFVNKISGRWKNIGIYEDYIGKTNKLYALFIKHKIPSGKLDEVFHISYGDWKVVKVGDVSELRLDGGLHSMEMVEELLQQDKVKARALLTSEMINGQKINTYTEELTYEAYLNLTDSQKSHIKIKGIEDTRAWNARGMNMKTLFPKGWTIEDISLVYKKANNDIKKILLEEYELPLTGPANSDWKNNGKKIDIIYDADLGNGKNIDVQLGGQYNTEGKLDFNINTLYPKNN